MFKAKPREILNETSGIKFYFTKSMIIWTNMKRDRLTIHDEVQRLRPRRNVFLELFSLQTNGMTVSVIAFYINKRSLHV